MPRIRPLEEFDPERPPEFAFVWLDRSLPEPRSRSLEEFDAERPSEIAFVLLDRSLPEPRSRSLEEFDAERPSEIAFVLLDRSLPDPRPRPPDESDGAPPLRRASAWLGSGVAEPRNRSPDASRARSPFRRAFALLDSGDTATRRSLGGRTGASITLRDRIPLAPRPPHAPRISSRDGIRRHLARTAPPRHTRQLAATFHGDSRGAIRESTYLVGARGARTSRCEPKAHCVTSPPRPTPHAPARRHVSRRFLGAIRESPLPDGNSWCAHLAMRTQGPSRYLTPTLHGVFTPCPSPRRGASRFPQRIAPLPDIPRPSPATG